MGIVYPVCNNISKNNNYLIWCRSYVNKGGTFVLPSFAVVVLPFKY